VLEEDGSHISDDMLATILDEGKKIGTLMLLRPREGWTEGVTLIVDYK